MSMAVVNLWFVLFCLFGIHFKSQVQSEGLDLANLAVDGVGEVTMNDCFDDNSLQIWEY
jgi:hypothetical protein